MAKKTSTSDLDFGADDRKATAADLDFGAGDTPAAKAELPKGVKPSSAGGGRGSVNPPPAIEAPADPVTDPMGGDLASAIANAGAKPVEMRSLVERSVEDAPYDRAQLEAQERRPAGNRAQQAAARPMSAEPYKETPKRGYVRAAADTGLGLYQGAAGMVEGAARMVPILGEPVADFLDTASKGADRLKSPELREQTSVRQGRIDSVKNSQGEMAAARAAFQTIFDLPAAGLDVVSQGAGSLVPTLALGSAGISPKAIEVLNALSTAGDAKKSTADKLRAIDPAAWRNDSTYQALRNAGMDHAQALGVIVPIYTIPSQAAGALAGAISGKLGVEETFANRAAGAGRRDAFSDRAMRVGAEHLGEQGETWLPGLAQNAVVGGVDGKTGLTEGMGQQTADTFAGTLGPGALAARSQASAPGALAPDQATTTPAPPVAPPVAPIPAAAAPVSPVAPMAPPPKPPKAFARAAARVGADAGPVPLNKSAEERQAVEDQILAIEQKDADTAAMDAALVNDAPAADQPLDFIPEGDLKARPEDLAKQKERQARTPKPIKETTDEATPAPAPADTQTPAATPATAAPVDAPVPAPSAEGGAGGGQAVAPVAPDAATTNLLDQARDIVTKSGRASVSNVQRHLKIGYNNAQRLMEQLEAEGVVGPMTTAGAREVLAKPGTETQSATTATPEAQSATAEGDSQRPPAAAPAGAAPEAAPGPVDSTGPAAAPGSNTAEAGDNAGAGVAGDAPAVRGGKRAGPTPADSTGADGAAATRYPDLKAATDYIREQRARGTSIAALPFTHEDGSVSVAIKGAPEYDQALEQRQQRITREANAKLGIEPDDVLNAVGKPFTTRSGAKKAVEARGADHEIVRLDSGGYVVRKAAAKEKPDAVASGGDANAVRDGDASSVRGGRADGEGSVGAGLGGPGGEPANVPAPAAPRGRKAAPVPAGGKPDATLKAPANPYTTREPDASLGAPIGPHVPGLGRAQVQGEGVTHASRWDGMPEDDRKAVLKRAGVVIGPEIAFEKLMPKAQERVAAAMGADTAKPTAEASIDAAAHEAATSPTNDLPEPTQAQKEAGNYKMGHLSGEQTQGIDITVENPKGSERKGTSPDGTAWSNTMGAHYGYAKRSLAADGDHVDVFVGPAADRAPTVWVIDQVNKDGSYDEAKALFGFMNKAAALRAYRASYMKGWKVGPVTEMSVSDFKAGLESGRFKKPLDPSLAPASARPALPDGVSIKSVGSNSFAAYKNGKVVGRAKAWEDSRGKFVIMESATSPGMRKKGIATALYQAIEKESGKQLEPAVSLSDDAFEFWKRYRPEAVAGDLRHMPSLVGRRAKKGEHAGIITQASGRGARLTYDDHPQGPGTHSTLAGRTAINDALAAAGGERLVPEGMAPDSKKAAPAAAPAAEPTPAPAAAPAPAPAEEPKKKLKRMSKEDEAHLFGLDKPPAIAKPKRETKAQKIKRETEEARATYFAPGNVVRGYAGFDRVISYQPAVEEGGRWSVAVQEVEEKDGKWVDSERSLERTHSTQPTESNLRTGPRAKVATPTLNSETQRSVDRKAAMAAEEAAPAPAPEPAPAAASRTPKPAAAPAIADFGEELKGAKKMLYTDDYKAKMADAMKADIATEPLSKSWPAPDYQKLIDGGADPTSVAFARAARDQVPSKPTKGWKLKAWAEKVETLRQSAEDALSGKFDVKEHSAWLKANNKFALNDWVVNQTMLYEAVGHAHSLKDVELSAGHYSMYGGVAYSPSKTIWSVSRSSKGAFGNWGKELGVGDTREEAIAKFKANYDKAFGQAADEAKKKVASFDIYSDRRANAATPIFIGKKIGGDVVRLKTGFKTVAEAREWRAGNQAALEASWANYKHIPSERKAENAPRVGQDHRNSGDVTPEQFAEAFGFRGVQFGNYVEGPRRQADLNRAYDALMDMAAVLGVPPQSLSLDGKLGLAFGARGSGGKDAAAAHYEPGQVVINLTKNSGAGSLAHEWWHALDNYFGKKDGQTGYLSATPNGAGDVRPEMRAAFAQIKRTLANIPLAARSKALDKRRSKPYWSTEHELSARAFESYVIAKLHDQNFSNDYLANVVPSMEWILNEEPSYPYPLADELPAVREAYDKFFETIETRETDRGTTEFFSRREEPPRDLGFMTTPAPAADQARADQLKARLAKSHPQVGDAFQAVDVVGGSASDPKATQTFQALRTVAKRLFGKDVVLVQFADPSKAFFAGVFSHAMPDTIFVNIDSRDPHLAVMGHELLHALRKDSPAIYNELTTRLANATQNLPGYYNMLTEAYADSPQVKVDDIFAEEFVADLVGQHFTDPEFWRQVAPESRSLARRIADAIVKFLDGVIQRLSRMSGPNSLGMDQYISDAKQARTAVVAAMRAYSASQAQSAGMTVPGTGEMLSKQPAAAAPAQPKPNLAKAVFGGSMAWTRDQSGKPVKLAEQKKAYEAIGIDERAEMLLRTGAITADQLKRWRESKLDIYEGAINNRFRKAFEAPGLVWRDDELRRLFNLDDAGIAEYRQLRAAADATITAQALDDMLRVADRTGQALNDEVKAMPLDLAAERLRDALLQVAEGHTTEGENGTPRTSAEGRATIERANKIIDILDAANDRMDHGHVPPDVAADVIDRPWSAPGRSRIDNLIYEWQDGKVDLKRVQEAIERDTQDRIEDQFNARLAETLYAGRVAKKSEDFAKDEVEPLLKAMRDAGITQAELGDYLHARAAPERNKQIAKVNPLMPDGGAGSNSKGLLLTTAAAKRYLDDIPAERRAVLDRMGGMVDRITAGTRAQLVADGLEDADTIAAWEGAYKHYVPMFREDIDFNRLTIHKRATGSERQAVNIVAQVLQQREAAIVRGEKNRIAIALYGLALTNPNPNFWATIRPDSQAEDIKADLERMGVDPLIAEAGMQGVPTVTDVDPVANRVTKRVNPMYRNLPGAITLKIKGEPRVLMLNVEDERAKRMAAAMKGADSLLNDYDVAGSIVGRATRWLAAVNTQYNPAFGIVNFWRDTSGGVVHLTNTELRHEKVRVMAGIPGAMRGIFHHLTGREDAGKWSRLFEQFMDEGGKTGFTAMFENGEKRAKEVERQLKIMSRGPMDPRRVGRMLLGLLSGFNEIMENAVRLSAYAAALDKGMSRPQAARLGRELTVDFNRKGRTGRTVGPLYAFFNAALQGTERTLRALRGPAGPQIIAGGFALGVMQGLMMAAAGFDDDDIPDFVKARALIIPLPGEGKRYIAVPLPLGLHVLPNTGRVLTEMALGDLQPKKLGMKAWTALGEIAGAFNPLGGGNVFTADGALKTVLPTVLDPLVELASNRNFAGVPIEQAERGDRDARPGDARTREGTRRTLTGQAYIGISKAVNKLTGGSDVEQGGISWTPERYRYIAQVLGGGVLRETERTINLSAAKLAGQEVPENSIPVMNRWYGKVDDQQVQRSKYFQNVNKLEKLEAEIKAAKKADMPEVLDRLQGKPEADAIRFGNRAQKAVNKLTKQVKETTDPAELKALDAERYAWHKDLNESIEQEEKARRNPTLGERVRASMGR